MRFSLQWVLRAASRPKVLDARGRLSLRSRAGAGGLKRKDKEGCAPMLFRFSLYGFLKNQVYFEPFLILAFLEKDLSFFQIGLLIGFREVCINIFEIPSGAVADIYGRRRSMIFSFLAYIASFFIFAHSASFATLMLAMFTFALGDSFRTGTHKAMIFEWLRIQGREDERTRVYGFTRSWSKMGSAVSVVIASAFIFTGARYSDIFLLAIIPYAMNIVNFMGYPRDLDGVRAPDARIPGIWGHLKTSMRQAFTDKTLRGILIESMGYEGTYKVAKDYIQPVIQQTALGLALLATWGQQQRVALLVGAIYFVLHLLSSFASRGGHRLVHSTGSEEAASKSLWGVTSLIYAALAWGLWMGLESIVIIGFVALAVLQNVWRPVLMSRIDAHSTPEAGATTLSVETQCKSLAAMGLAPFIGFCVDAFGLVGMGVVATLATLPFALAGLGGSRQRPVHHP